MKRQPTFHSLKNVYTDLGLTYLTVPDQVQSPISLSDKSVSFTKPTPISRIKIHLFYTVLSKKKLNTFSMVPKFSMLVHMKQRCKTKCRKVSDPIMHIYTENVFHTLTHLRRIKSFFTKIP